MTPLSNSSLFDGEAEEGSPLALQGKFSLWWVVDLIVNADDFGRSHDVNRAVELAWRDGILTSASLMVTGDAVAEAVALAQQATTAAVGLHLTLTELPPVLPRDQVPHLLDPATGCFPRDPAVAGWRLFWSRAARRELAAEMEAQFQRFAATGLPLSHVDGHQHLHVHPVVFDLLLPLLERYRPAGLRIPSEPLPWGWRHRREQPAGAGSWRNRAATALRQAVHGGFFALLGARARRRLGCFPSLVVPRRTYGLMYTGQMDEPRLLAYLGQLRDQAAGQTAGCVEMYLHPTVGPRVDPLGANRGDLQALLSPRVRTALAATRFSLTTYAGAALAAPAPPVPAWTAPAQSAVY